MTQATGINRRATKTRRVFISYRREGGQAFAVAFHRGLTQVLGDDSVFLDVGRSAMETGRPWRDSVEKAIGRSDTLLLIFDPGMETWLSEPENAIRFEVETAIEKGLRIAVVRVDKAVLPEASGFPLSLSILSTLHSPTVHSDTAVEDMDRVIKDLTGRAPGETKAIDKWDIGALAILFLVGIVPWQVKGVHYFNRDETLLWGFALLIPWFVWMTVKRTVPFGLGFKRHRNFALAGLWLFSGIVFSAVWFAGFMRVYEKPSFGNAGGIMVARFEGDPNDEVRDDVVAAFREEVSNLVGTRADSLVKAWPFLIRDDARVHGKATGASAVIWGKVTDRENRLQTVVAQIALIAKTSVLEPTGLLRGNIDRADLRLSGALELTQETLPRLLEGYREYFAATDSFGYKRALRNFENALEATESGKDADGPLSTMTASLQLYRGNALWLTGRKDLATNAFREAIRRSMHDQDEQSWPTYIEAVSNLGVALLEQGEPHEAIRELIRSDSECSRDSSLEACAYAWYNLGVAYQAVDDYEAAAVRFEAAISRLNTTESTSDTALETNRVALKAYSLQKLAYGLVWQATRETPFDSELLDLAETRWELGRRMLDSARVDIPDWFYITSARLLIARQQWDEAVDLISSLKLRGFHRLNAAGLLAGAYQCVQKTDSVNAIIGRLITEADETGVDDALAEMSRISQECGSTL